MSFGTTAAGVVRNGRIFGFFHKVYTVELSYENAVVALRHRYELHP